MRSTLAFVFLATLSVLVVSGQDTTQLERGQGAVALQAPRAGWEDIYEAELKQDNEDPPRQYYRVRETFYAPPPPPTSSPSPPATLPTAEPSPRHIVTSLSHLRPILKWGILHPLRAAAVALPYLARVSWSATKLVASAARYILSLFVPLFNPISFVLYTVSRPARQTFAVFWSLRPLWISVIAALSLGAGLGALAGVVTAQETRKVLDRLSAVSLRLEWILGGRPGEGKKREVEGARLERIDVKGKGKARAMDGGGEGIEGWYRDTSSQAYTGAERKWYGTSRGAFDDSSNFEDLEDDDETEGGTSRSASKSASSKARTSGSSSTTTRRTSAGKGISRRGGA